VAAGGSHTVGLESGGTVVCVGGTYNHGQCDVGSWSGIQQVAAGESHTVGLEAGGTVVCVGYNGDGQCDVGLWTGIQQVAAGADHTVGLKADGTVVCVGGTDNHAQCNVDDWNLLSDSADFDGDGDGFTEYQGDCDDNDNSIYPGAQEICGDSIDQDCDRGDKICPNLQSVYLLLLGK